MEVLTNHYMYLINHLMQAHDFAYNLYWEDKEEYEKFDKEVLIPMAAAVKVAEFYSNEGNRLCY